MKADYIIRVGESLTLSLLLVEGDVSVVSSVEAVLKAAGPNGTVPPLSAPIVATFAVAPVAAPDVGWNFILEDEETALLKPGFYVTNAKLNLEGGSVTKTEAIILEVKGSVT